MKAIICVIVMLAFVSGCNKDEPTWEVITEAKIAGCIAGAVFVITFIVLGISTGILTGKSPELPIFKPTVRAVPPSVPKIQL